MADRDNGNAPAFPRPTSTDEHDKPCNVYQDQQGMSLRDYFAAAALPALIGDYQRHPDVGPSDLAAEAYMYADAMLVQRTREAGE